jgi:hypothetical protein
MPNEEAAKEIYELRRNLYTAIGNHIEFFSADHDDNNNLKKQKSKIDSSMLYNALRNNKIYLVKLLLQLH